MLVVVGLGGCDSKGGLDGPLSALSIAEIQESLLWSKKFVADVAMMSGGVVFGHVVGQVEGARAPVEAELIA